TICCQWSWTSWAYNDRRPAATRLTSPRPGSKGCPDASGIRKAMSPPDGSASIAVIGRGQMAPINKAVVVTPGEPLTDATVSMAISQPPQVSLTAGLSPPMSAGGIAVASIAHETGETDARKTD